MINLCKYGKQRKYLATNSKNNLTGRLTIRKRRTELKTGIGATVHQAEEAGRLARCLHRIGRAHEAQVVGCDA